MRIVEPRVQLVAWTVFATPDGVPWEMEEVDETRRGGGDDLAEFAGRACYEAWGRPNPETAANVDYIMRNLIDKKHGSVFEHASASFYVTGVSRALLLELERHRHLSFSVRSQRYVPETDAAMVVPPVIGSSGPLRYLEALNQAGEAALKAYDLLYGDMRRAGLPVKKAREAARAALPNMTETRFVVTGNMRCWRYVLGLRWHADADAEIRRFAGMVLEQLRDLNPHSFQDFPTVYFGSGQ